MNDHGYPKVLHLIANLQIGGTEGQLVQFANRSSEPLRHHVACFYSIGELGDAFPTEPIWLGRIGRRPADAAGNLRVLRTLRRTIVSGGYDVVHAHLGLSEVIAAMTTPRGIPIVASRRGRNRGFESNAVLKLVEGAGHRRVDVLICNSGYLAEITRAEDHWPPPTVVIPNAVDTERFAPVSPADGSPTVVTVANFHPYKGHVRLLQAISLVRQHLPDVRSVLVGDGPRRGTLEQAVRELDLVDNVTFAGQVLDPRPFVAHAHVVALASDTEGFPNALLEAMAMGRPVVARDVGGIPELVRDGTDGFLVGADPREMADRLTEVLLDPGLRDRQGQAGRARAETFTWNRVVRETEEVYRDAVSGRRGRG